MTRFKKSKTFPLLLGLTGVIATAWLYLGNPDLTRDTRPQPEETGAAPDVFLTDIRQATYENGHPRWTLKAASARLIRKEQNTDIKELVMTIYAADGNTSEITADKGIFFMDTGNAEISGNVIIDNGTFQIHTQSLQYRGKTHILSTAHPVIIKSDSLHLTGDSMVYDARRMKAVIEGNVEGRF